MAFERTKAWAKWLRCTIALAVVIGLLLYFFVVEQLALIARPGLIVALVVGLIVTAFWVSATEKAFSVAPNDKDVRKAINDVRIDLMNELKKETDERKKNDLKRRAKRLRKKTIELEERGETLSLGRLRPLASF